MFKDGDKLFLSLLRLMQRLPPRPATGAIILSQLPGCIRMLIGKNTIVARQIISFHGAKARLASQSFEELHQLKFFLLEQNLLITYPRLKIICTI